MIVSLAGAQRTVLTGYMIAIHKSSFLKGIDTMYLLKNILLIDEKEVS